MKQVCVTTLLQLFFLVLLMALNDVSCLSQAVTLQSTNDLTDDLCDKISDALASSFSNCQYYDFDLNQMSWSNDNNVILLHVIIRSLQKNFDSLCELLNPSPISRILYALTKHELNTNH